METRSVPEQFLKLSSAEEVRLLLEGVDLIKGNKAVVLQDLKRRITFIGRYFKSLSPVNSIKAAADKRNLQRRRDGRG